VKIFEKTLVKEINIVYHIINNIKGSIPEATERMKKMKKMTKLGLFLAVVVCVSMLMAFASSAVTLSDIQNHWAKEYIEYGVQKGYISGYADGTFLPDKTVTRAEFSKMINNAIGITATGSAKGAFSDVVSSEWYFNEVKKAENAGYITGYEDGTFRPSNTVTRQEAAVILSRLVIPTSSRADINTFGDGKTIDTWATDAVSMIAFKGYIKGDENGNFIPKGQLTRSQAAKLICEFVKNENIVNGAQTANTVEGGEVVFSETLFTDGLTVNFKSDAEATVLFKNCRVLGDVTFASENAYFKLDNTKLGNLNIKAANMAVEANRAAAVKHTYVNYPVTLNGEVFDTVTISGSTVGGQTVAIDGTCKVLNVSADVLLNATSVKTLNVTGKSNLVIQKADVDVLNVESTAAGSLINLLTVNAKIDTANSKAAVTYRGLGTIQTAVVDAKNVVFDGVKPKTTTGSNASSTGTSTATGFFANATFTPKDKATGVDVDANVVISFKDKVLDKDGKTLTATYIKDNIQLRKASASGSKVTFVATIASSKKITLNPSANLSDGYKYYIVIPAGVLTFEDGTENEKYTGYFTVGEDEDEDENQDEFFEDVTITPKNKASNVSESANIVFTFDEEVFDDEGDDLTASYATSNIFLRKNTASGTRITCTGSVTSGGKKITLNPVSNLTDGKYYIVIAAGALTYEDGSENQKFTSYFTVGEDDDEDEGDEFLGMTVSPTNKKTNVAVTSNIIFNFDDEVFDDEGDEIDEDYVEDYFQIREKNSSGTKIDFTATVNSSGTKITLNPDDNLEEGTRYYVIIPAGTLTDEDENENDKFTSYFNTKGDSDDEDEDEDDLFAGMTVSPAAGKQISSLSANIIISFDEAVYDDGEDKLTATYMQSNIELRKDSATGTKVAFTASISSTNKKITINPTANLANKSKYYLIIPDGTFTNKDGDENDEFEMFFTTTGYERDDSEFFDGVEVDPADKEKNVAVNSNIVFTFDEEVLNDERDELDDDYVEDEFEIRKGSVTGTKVTFAATIASSNKKITLNPSNNFESAQIYYVIIPAGTLKYEDKTENEKFVMSFTTPGYVSAEDIPKITDVTYENVDDTSFDVVVKASHSGTLSVVIKDGSTKIDEKTVTYTKGEAKSVSFTQLTPDTSYDVVVYIISNSIKSAEFLDNKTTAEEEENTACPDCGKEDCTDTTGKYCADCDEHGHEESDVHCEKCGDYGCTDAREVCATCKEHVDAGHCPKCCEDGGNHKETCEDYEAPCDCGEENCTDTREVCATCNKHVDAGHCPKCCEDGGNHKETCEDYEAPCDCGEENCTDAREVCATCKEHVDAGHCPKCCEDGGNHKETCEDYEAPCDCGEENCTDAREVCATCKEHVDAGHCPKCCEDGGNHKETCEDYVAS